MANPEHLEILNQGVEVWNRWRDVNVNVIPNLIGTDLRRIDLHRVNLSLADLHNVNFLGTLLGGADFTGADISHADLRVSDLSGANLSSTDLRASNLSGADLRGATIAGARLGGADLSRANLSRTYASGARLDGADLSHANLSEAILKNADLSRAHLADVMLANANFSAAMMTDTIIDSVDLSEAKNLDLVRHVGPSKISIDTIYKSRGKIPEKFLRGCGIPESFIVQIPALVAAIEPIQFYSCFISYTGKDEEFAKRLYADLQNEGVRCWFAPEDLKIGDKFRARIDESIRLYDKLLLVLSENSVASEWVEKEVETALEKEQDQKKIVLFPVRLDDAILGIKTGWAADVRRSRHIGDFRKWKTHNSYRRAFDRLMRDLKAEAQR